MTKAKQLLGAAVLLACGCESMSHGERGAVAGGAIGAGTGAIVGNAVGHTGGGALIGGAIGALSGALIGDSVDKSEKRAAQAAAAAQAPPLGMTDVANMAQQHISDDVIITQIRSTSSVYRLSPSDITWLKQNGVSDTVVMEMQATASRYRRVYTATPVYAPPPVVIYEPAPPPVAVGVGIEFSR